MELNAPVNGQRPGAEENDHHQWKDPEQSLIGYQTLRIPIEQRAQRDPMSGDINQRHDDDEANHAEGC